MCSGLRRHTLAIVALSVLGEAMLAQSPAVRTRRDSLLRRSMALETLAGRYDEAIAAANAEQKRARDAMLPDTVVVGRFRAVVRGVPVVAARRLLQTADSVMTRSWASQMPAYPGAVLALDAVLVPGGSPRQIRAEVGWAHRGVPRQQSRAIAFAPVHDRALLADGAALANLWLDPWRSLPEVKGNVLDVVTDTVQFAGEVYRELAASPFHAGRTCLGGDLAACSRVMGLTPPIAPYDDLLDATGRAAILAEREARGWEIRYAERQGCIETQDPELCRRAFSSVTPEMLAPFLEHGARRMLATQVLANAAATLPARLATPPKAPSSAGLEALTGDTLLRAIGTWRAQVIRHRPRDVLPTATVSWGTLVLVAGITALGFRSSRWRSL